MLKFNKFSAVLALVVAMALSVFATSKKAPVTLMFNGKQHYVEWSGTAIPMNASDNLIFYTDTSGTPTAINPTWLYQTDASQYWPGASFPAKRVPEKICGNIVSRAEADSSTMVIEMQYAASATATRYSEGAGASAIFPGTTVIGQTVSSVFVPGKFFVPKVTISTATDSLYPVRATFWACDD